jgi:hypothetical protein
MQKERALENVQENDSPIPRCEGARQMRWSFFVWLLPMQAHISKPSPKKGFRSQHARSHHNDTPIAIFNGNLTSALCCSLQAPRPSPSFPAFAFQLATTAPNPA